jgi:hypothetical protein
VRVSHGRDSASETIIYFAILHLPKTPRGTPWAGRQTAASTPPLTLNWRFSRVSKPATKPPDVRERLREQLEARRKMAREPHVLRLTELHRQAQTKMVFSRMTKH